MLTPDQSTALAPMIEEGCHTAFAPYRVCLVGAHIDHQGGTVTGFALEQGLAMAYAEQDDASVRITDALSGEHVRMTLTGDPLEGASANWASFVRGAIALSGPLGRGVMGSIAGSLPAGGLSSSAALSLTLMSALSHVSDEPPLRTDLPGLAMQLENEYVGVNCGLMDPTVIVHARRDHLVTLDCSTGEVEVIQGPRVSLVAIYSGISRSLVATGFNDRTAECREAARELARRGGLGDTVQRLGDVPEDLIASRADELATPLNLRATHYLTESQRVRRAIECWRAGDLEGFGQCASESMVSSMENYETGSEEQRFLARALAKQPGVYGARFCGGGFGGFVAGVCDPDLAEQAAQGATAAYAQAYPDHAADAFGIVSRPSDGLREL